MNMIEKIAQIIDNTYFYPRQNTYAQAKDCAKAILKAMREPTEGMGRIAREERAFLDLPSYRSLIDAALNEHQEK